MAQICAPSNAHVGNGIGDVCSVPQNVPIFFPHIGIFQSTFTPACDQHDKCYTWLGADYGSCDSAFYDDMRNRCDSKYNKILRPVEWAACRQTPFEYYTAVKEYRRYFADPKSANNANYDESKANPYPELPPLLQLEDGTPVTSSRLWSSRRAEIK